MVATKSILVALLCAVAQLSIAGTVPVAREEVSLSTNAARMAAGLNPLPPRGVHRRTLSGRSNYGQHYGQNMPPPPQASPKPQPPKPDIEKRGSRLKCKRVNGGAHIGWVARDFSLRDRNKKGFGLCSSRDSALSVDFESSDDSTPLNLRLPNHGDFPFLGWAGNNLNSDNSCILTKTKQTNNNSPSNVGNAFSSWAANSESNFWFFGRGSRSFSFKWHNTGGAQTQTKTFYNPAEDLFHLVTDVGRFMRRCPQAFEVEFELDD